MSISSVVGVEQESYLFYKNIATSKLLMWMLFVMVDVVLNQVTYFSTKITYSFLKLLH